MFRARLGALRRSIRQPSLYLAAAAITVSVTAGITYRFLSVAQEGAARYGRPVAVYVAAEDLAAGSVIGSDDVERRSLPASAVPASALRRSPVGSTLGQEVASGQVIVGGALSRAGRSPLAASLPPGTVAVAVPRSVTLPPLRRDDRVDLWVAADTRPLEVGAPVVAVEPDSVVVAVSDDSAGAVAAALLAGPVLLAVRGAR